MTIRAMRLDNWGVKDAMRHPLLEGKKIIGRGVFSVVFEGSRKNTVLKMTCDDIGYWAFNDYALRVQHRHFPRIVESHGDIGEIRIKGLGRSIYLFEMERLEKLQAGSDAKRLARLISKVGNATSARTAGHWTEHLRAATLLQQMAKDSTLPRSVRNALADLCRFCHDYPGGTLDMHGCNFMQRGNGELVMTDPIANMQIWMDAQAQVRMRGW